MALAIGTPNAIKTVIKLDDNYTDTLSTTLLLNPAISSDDLTSILNLFDQLTEAHIDYVNQIAENIISGQKAAAIAALQNLVSVQAILTFDANTPKRDGSIPKVTVKLPSPVANLIFNVQGKINPTGGTLSTFIGLIAANIGYEIDKVDGVPTYAYGATFNLAESGFITGPRELK